MVCIVCVHVSMRSYCLDGLGMAGGCDVSTFRGGCSRLDG